MSGLTFISAHSYAIKAPGYIITRNSDTVYGKVILPVFDQVTGNWIFDGFDLNALHLSVSFKAEDKKAFTIMYPADIRGFGFTYKTHPYTFKSFVLVYNSIFRKDEKTDRFLLLVHQGKIDLYQDIEYVNNSWDRNAHETFAASCYYLYTGSRGLLRVEKNDLTPTIHDLLHQFGLEQEFIDEIPKNANFKDIKHILDEYDNWSPGN